jgi:hypothetical protein
MQSAFKEEAYSMRNIRNIITKVIFIFIIAFLSAPISIKAETVKDVAKKIHSPKELEKFYADGFNGEYKIPDYEKSPQETLDSKYGDCKDFAVLTHAILDEMGIPSEVVYIKFLENKFGHAICVWKEGDYYNYFDVTKLVETKYTSVQDVMDSAYLNMECCTSCKKKLEMETGKCK